MKHRTFRGTWPAVVILVLILCVCVVLILSQSAHGSTTILTGTVKDAFGQPINGTLTLQLPVPAQDTTTSVAVANTPITCRLVNGAVTSCPPLYDVANLQPQNLYYNAIARDNSGTPVWGGNFAITGGSYNLGAAVPTSVTTNNVSFVNPAVTSATNTFCCTQNFQGQIVSTVSGGTAPFSIGSSTVVPNLNVNNLNGTTISNSALVGQVLTGTGSGTAAWSGAGITGFKSECVNVTAVTVANTVALSPLQTCILPANDIGIQTFYIDAFGVVGATGTPTALVCAYIDSTSIGCAGTGTLAASANQPWSYRAYFTGLTTGVGGTMTGAEGLWASTPSGGGITTLTGTISSPFTVNTTISHVIQLQVTWSAASASNTITSQSFTVHRIG